MITEIPTGSRDALDRERDALTKLVSADHGKTVDDARGEVERGIEVVEFACNIVHLLEGEFSERVGTNIDACSLRQPWR